MEDTENKDTMEDTKDNGTGENVNDTYDKDMSYSMYRITIQEMILYRGYREQGCNGGYIG